MTEGGAAELEVLLHGNRVGTLRMSGTQEAIRFDFTNSYLARAPRPVLSQSFIDRPQDGVVSRQRLPPFFSNLLPEGPLRQRIAEEVGVHEDREFHLLARLGDDLPGAVAVRGQPASRHDLAAATTAIAVNGAEFRFSLAGVQLKLSALKTERGLTVPASGRGGRWIVKLPDSRFPEVPANEAGTLLWARRAGIDVPDFELVEIDRIEGIPLRWGRHSEPRALCVRRFDREDDGTRVHCEDLAQALGAPPSEKYHGNYETVARLLMALCGPLAVERLVRRLVFHIACGNFDGHLKNWGILYSDRVTAALAPAYDIVSVVQYEALFPDRARSHDRLALKLNKQRYCRAFGRDAFDRLARKAGIAQATMRMWVDDMVLRTRAGWIDVRAELPWPETWKQRIEQRWRELPMLR